MDEAHRPFQKQLAQKLTPIQTYFKTYLVDGTDGGREVDEQAGLFFSETAFYISEKLHLNGEVQSETSKNLRMTHMSPFRHL